jgi:hypothetical protein
MSGKSQKTPIKPREENHEKKKKIFRNFEAC